MVRYLLGEAAPWRCNDSSSSSRLKVSHSTCLLRLCVWREWVEHWLEESPSFQSLVNISNYNFVAIVYYLNNHVRGR